MAHAAPGKSDREGVTMMQLCDMFPPRKVHASGLNLVCGQMAGIARDAEA